MTREDPLERAQRITRELRAATAEAAGVLKDLRATLRGAHEMVDAYAASEVSAVMNTHLQTCQDNVDQWYRDMTEDHKRVCDQAQEIHAKLLTRLGAGFEMVIDKKYDPGDGSSITILGTLKPHE